MRNIRVEAPMCAKCGRFVDKLTRELDPVNGDLLFKAYCHGEMEPTRISAANLQQGDIVTLQSGIAFADEVKRVDVKA